MKRMFAIFVAVLLLAGAAAAQSPPEQKIPSGWIQVDGAKNPELIPEWKTWELTFQLLAEAKGTPTDIMHQATPGDVALMFAVARENVQQQKGCLSIERMEEATGIKVEDLKERLKTMSPEAIGALQRDMREKEQVVHIECRWKTLGNRDKLLAQLSPEAAQALRTFAEQRKTGLSLSAMPKELLAAYRQPE